MTAIRPSDPCAVSLQELWPGAERDAVVTGITLDSREVSPGWLYAALPGAMTHGAKFATQAVAAGASAVLTDEAGSAQLPDALGVPAIVVGDVREVLGDVAAKIFEYPARRLTTFGVTGTNGKTTTVMLTAAGLAAAGHSVGTIGTLGFRVGQEELPSSRSTVTTPEAPDLQALLAVMAERGADAVGLEVSSHALAMGRVGGICFDVVGFLNLGRDHLDFHKTPEEYFAAKRKLFDQSRSKAAVVWIDDEYGARIADSVRAAGKPGLVTVGSHDADYVLSNIRAQGRLGGSATVRRRGEDVELALSIPGRYNMVDAAVAFAMLEAAGVSTQAALAGLASAQVPGRMQRAILDADAPLVIVDFAHTPQAVSAVLEELAKLGPLTTVVGCGGDRDGDKRPLMGAAAAKFSHRVIVTDDNPRTEDPVVIRAAVMRGAIGQGAEVVEIEGRADAIARAIAEVELGGVVAILGKGHERGQIFADYVVDFDDVAVAQAAWARRSAAGGVAVSGGQ